MRFPRPSSSSCSTGSWPAPPTAELPGTGAAAARSTDRRALGRLLEEEGDRLFALALRVTRSPDLAADAVQEAFATALERLESFRGESRLGTWMYRIVYNKAIDLLRRRGREQPLDENDPELTAGEVPLGQGTSWSRPPDELLFSAEAHAALERAVSELTPVQRAVFSLREIEGKSANEIGRILEMPPGTVRVHLHRARMRLRDRLGPLFRGSVQR